MMAIWPVAAASPENDAGLGRDASDVRESAEAVGFGTLHGEVGPWEYRGYVDQYDWYRLDAPAGAWVHVGLERPGGADVLWTNLEVRDAEGALLRFFSYPHANAFGIDVAAPGGPLFVAVWLYPGNPAAEYALTLAPIPEGDGGAADAPERWQDARPLAMGDHAGRLDPAGGDTTDWYAIDVPARQGLLVVMTPTNGNARLEARTDAGELRDTRDNGWIWPRDMRLGHWTDRWRIGVNTTDGGGGSYTLHVEPLPLPDMRLIAIDAGPERLDTSVTAEPRWLRDVTVTLENVGDAADTAYVQTWVYPRGPAVSGGGPSRHLGVSYATLAPGERATVTHEWDETGEIGAQELGAYVGTRFDIEWSNNYGTARADSVAPVDGRGDDLLNGWKGLSAGPVSVGAASWYRSCYRANQRSYEQGLWVGADLAVYETGARRDVKDCEGLIVPESPVPAPPLLSPRARMASAPVDGVTYLLGGEGEDGPLDEILAFDPRLEAALPTNARLPSPRAGVAAATDGAFVYLFGGQGADGARLDEIVRYHPATGIVETLAAKLPSGRYGAQAIWDAREKPGCEGGCAYVFGGIGWGREWPWDPYAWRELPIDEIVRFHPASGTVTLLATRLPEPQLVGPLLWNGTEALFFGLASIDYPGAYGDGWWYDPLGDRGRSEDQWMMRRDGGNAVWVGDVAYVVGGENFTGCDCDPATTGFAWDPTHRTIAYMSGFVARAHRDATFVQDGERGWAIGGYNLTSGTLSNEVTRWSEPHRWWRDYS